MKQSSKVGTRPILFLVALLLAGILALRGTAVAHAIAPVDYCISANGMTWDPFTTPGNPVCIVSGFPTIPAGQLWDVPPNTTLQIQPGAELTINGELSLSGTLLNKSQVANNGIISYSGLVKHRLPDARYIGSGTMSRDSQTAAIALYTEATGLNRAISMANYGPANNNKEIIAGDTLTIIGGGSVTVPAGHRLINGGTLTVSGGSINAETGSFFWNGGGLTVNTGSLTNSGAFDNLAGGVVTIGLNQTLTNNGTLNNLGLIDNNNGRINNSATGTINNGFRGGFVEVGATIDHEGTGSGNNGMLDNAGTINNGSSGNFNGRFKVNGRINNTGAINNNTGTFDVGNNTTGYGSIWNNSATGTITNNGPFNLTRGAIWLVAAGSSFENQESVIAGQPAGFAVDFYIGGGTTLINTFNAEFTNNTAYMRPEGAIVNDGTFTNNSRINAEFGSTLGNTGEFVNHVDGILEGYAAITNDALFTNYGRLDIGRTFDNTASGDLQATGDTVTVLAGGTLTNDGTITVSDTLDNYGTLTNRAAITNNGIVSTFGGSTFTTTAGTVTNNTFFYRWCGSTLVGTISGNAPLSNCTLTTAYTLADAGSCEAIGGVWTPSPATCTVDNLTNSAEWFIIASPITLVVDEEFNNTNTGKAEINALSVAGSVQNNGYLSVTTLSNYGTIENYAGFYPDSAINATSGVITLRPGTALGVFKPVNTGTINNHVFWRIYYNYENDGIINNFSTLDIWAEVTNSSTGEIYNHVNASIVVQDRERDYFTRRSLGGDFINEAGGLIDNSGLLRIADDIENWSNEDNVTGEVIVSEVAYMRNRGELVNRASGTIRNEDYFYVTSGSTTTNQGMFDNLGLLKIEPNASFWSTANSFISNKLDAIIDIAGSMFSGGSWDNFGQTLLDLPGDIWNSFGLSYHNYGTLINSGTIHNNQWPGEPASSGRFVNESGGTFTNAGGTFENGTGSFENEAGGSVTNTGTFNVGSGTAANSGQFESTTGAQVNGSISGTPPTTSPNSAPVAQPDTVNAAKNAATFITLQATDGNSDTLTYRLAGSVTNGLVTITGNQARFVPLTDYTGPASFSFIANDGQVDSNLATVSVNVDVSDNSAPTADAGGPYLVAVNSSIAFDGSGSSDPDLDTLTETWSASGETVSGSTYTASEVPGIYDVCLTVNDGTVDSDPNCTFVVVYDPTGGFVTGGGWIDSPTGAYTADPDLTGKATFGFVAKYKKGANVPDGNTQFQFQAGDLNFHSTSYDWLVVAGANAKFKGVGTINGAGEYGFMITARDGDLLGGGQVDGFRIKIWDAGGGVVYDNQMGQDDSSEATNDLGGGSIVIHKGKK